MKPYEAIAELLANRPMSWTSLFSDNKPKSKLFLVNGTGMSLKLGGPEALIDYESLAPSCRHPTKARELTRPVAPSSVESSVCFLGDAGMNHRNAGLAIGQRV